MQSYHTQLPWQRNVMFIALVWSCSRWRWEIILKIFCIIFHNQGSSIYWFTKSFTNDVPLAPTPTEHEKIALLMMVALSCLQASPQRIPTMQEAYQKLIHYHFISLLVHYQEISVKLHWWGAGCIFMVVGLLPWCIIINTVSGMVFRCYLYYWKAA